MIPPNINKHTVAFICSMKMRLDPTFSQKNRFKAQFAIFLNPFDIFCWACKICFHIFHICCFRFSVSSRDIAMLLRLSARAAFTSFHLKAFVSSMLLLQQLEEEEGEYEVFLVLQLYQKVFVSSMQQQHKQEEGEWKQRDRQTATTPNIWTVCPNNTNILQIQSRRQTVITTQYLDCLSELSKYKVQVQHNVMFGLWLQRFYIIQSQYMILSFR